MSEERLLNIETTLAFQDDLLLALNRTVADQQQTIDALRKHVEMLAVKVLELSEVAAANHVIDERPPHY